MENPLDNDLSLTQSCVTIPNTCFYHNSFSPLHSSTLFSPPPHLPLFSSRVYFSLSDLHPPVFTPFHVSFLVLYLFQTPYFLSYSEKEIRYMVWKKESKQLNISMEMHYLLYDLSLAARVSCFLFLRISFTPAWHWALTAQQQRWWCWWKWRQ